MPLAPLTTLKVGGPARFFVDAHVDEHLDAALRFAHSAGLSVFILGGGSNVLVSDRGFDGIVIRIRMKGITEDPAAAGVITSKAGEDWDNFVKFCIEHNFAGIECLSGIPGLVGGTPVQNVGAYGREVAETIISVHCFDRELCSPVTLSNEDCQFSYRKSVFNSTMPDRYVVLSVTFGLAPGGEPRIVYNDLREIFGDRVPTLSETREAVLRIRAGKSMVIDAEDPNSRSAGSFFKNPVGDHLLLERIASAADGPVPHFDAGGGQFKIPAAWLIEQSGFRKGYSLGNAGISTKHSLAIVNRGSATATEIVALKDKIADAVAARFGVELTPEPIFIGFD